MHTRKVDIDPSLGEFLGMIMNYLHTDYGTGAATTMGKAASGSGFCSRTGTTRIA